VRCLDGRPCCGVWLRRNPARRLGCRGRSRHTGHGGRLRRGSRRKRDLLVLVPGGRGVGEGCRGCGRSLRAILRPIRTLGPGVLVRNAGRCRRRRWRRKWVALRRYSKPAVAGAKTAHPTKISAIAFATRLPAPGLALAVAEGRTPQHWPTAGVTRGIAFRDPRTLAVRALAEPGGRSRIGFETRLGEPDASGAPPSTTAPTTRGDGAPSSGGPSHVWGP